MVNENGIFMNKKKMSIWFVVLGAVLCAYAGYLLNGAWEPGIEMNAFLESFNRVCAEPFADYYNETTLKAVVIALTCYATALLMYVTSRQTGEKARVRHQLLAFAFIEGNGRHQRPERHIHDGVGEAPQQVG